MIVALYVGIVFHEVAHGYAAYIMGDPTAKIWGRLTLRPSKHIDPIGLITPIVLILINSPFVIGWAKPVPVNYSLLKKKNAGLFFVAIAGVVVNLINVIWATLLLKTIAKPSVDTAFQSVFGSLPAELTNWQNVAAIVLVYIIVINMGLAIFNLIPIPPLDGSKIIEAIGGQKVRNFMESMESYGFIIIIVLVYFNLIDKIIGPVFTFGMGLVMKLLG
jgi:Zn-dependent proteases